MKLFPVVMAGGSGTRFWPLSRKARPKQFLALVGETPLLAATVARLPPLAKLDRTFVVCGPAHAAAARRILPDLPKDNLLVEPCARNTAPCVGLAALHVARLDKKGVLAMLPADHHVARPAAFREALAAAAEVAQGGAIVTLGVKPSRPETGYGYLKVGARLDGPPGEGREKPRGKAKPAPAKPAADGGAVARRVAKFVEKPDRATAQRYLADGGYLWNSGIFVFRADVILDEIRRTLPDLGEQLERIDRAIGTPRAARALAEAFPRCPAISIDYGVMEKSDRIAVVPGDFGWSDVGSFDALREVRAQDARGNVVEGEAMIFDGKDNVVLGLPGRPLAVIGVDDLIVVDAGDAVLVCRRDRAQDVRKAVDELKRRGREEMT
ncbi:mannose-1-phosphate guanylyltransferase [Anaeromyxobacter diazotrophicus]|uniref:mannose-1-phosphate guanylyltransferase n=1 Tax=Anaeromyxobacter diazotrophicus TaxID=2590199 RepID=A0A7I9VQD9_9BACT|nr:mannose-1-phosphate guanylyltransferase [Anaeromyxobacter diazotrophicus]GEJ58615.1 mannose-1-phosphate guanylyltransferase [Anaeromyxobacter diazotrophicus]